MQIEAICLIHHEILTSAKSHLFIRDVMNAANPLPCARMHANTHACMSDFFPIKLS